MVFTSKEVFDGVKLENISTPHMEVINLEEWPRLSRNLGRAITKIRRRVVVED